MRAFFSLLVLSLFTACSGAAALPASSPEPVSPAPTEGSGSWIAVSGQGEAIAVPDVLQVQLGVSVAAASVAQAMGEASRAASALVGLLRGNGVAQEDVQTTSLSLWPERRYGETGPVTYHASLTVAAKLRDLARAGQLLDQAVAQTGDALTISGLYWTVDDLTPYERRAREAAMADAQRRAQQLAAAAGVRLGPPLNVRETVGHPPVPYPLERALAASPEAQTVPLEGGSLRVTVGVEVVYSISPS